FCSRISARPLLVRSAVPTTFQLAPGPANAVSAVGVVPFISHTPMLEPLCQTMPDLPLALKSPVAMTRQPAGAGKAASAMGVVPFISQIPGVPPVLCHMMSDRPSPLKSPIPTTCQDVGVPKLAEAEGIVPAEFVQIVAVPVLVFCQTMSA